MGAARRRGGLAIATLAALTVGGCQTPSTPATHKGPLIQAPASCSDLTMSIYFEAYSAAVTHEAGQLLDAAAKQAQGCRATGVSIIGLADAPGGPDANLELSRRRAEAVTHALRHRGFKALDFEVTAAGEAGAQTPQGQARPLRRRADVIFHLAPR